MLLDTQLGTRLISVKDDEEFLPCDKETDIVLEGATLCLTMQRSASYIHFTFSHTAHNITLLDAMGSMLLETFAKGFPLMGQQVLQDPFFPPFFFAMTATKYNKRSIQTNIKVWLFVMI